MIKSYALALGLIIFLGASCSSPSHQTTRYTKPSGGKAGKDAKGKPKSNISDNSKSNDSLDPDEIDNPRHETDMKDESNTDSTQRPEPATPPPVVLGKTVPTPAGGPGASRFQVKGEMLLDKIITDFRVPSLGLYAEAIDANSRQVDGSGGASFVWPASHIVRALRSAAMVNRDKYLGELKSYSASLSRYKHGVRLTAATDPASDPYYDDNAIVGESLLDAAIRTGHDDNMLSLGKMGIDFCFNARDANYGVPQLEKQLGWGMYYSQSTILPALGAVKYARISKDSKYLDLAHEYFQRSKNPGTGLVAMNGLYNQYSFIVNNKASLTTPMDSTLNGSGLRAYQSTPMVQLALYLSIAKSDPALLKEAQDLAEKILTQWYRPNQGVNEISYWGGSDVVEMLLDLYEHDQNPRWLNVARDIVSTLAAKGMDKRGYFASSADSTTGNWNVDRREANPSKIEIMGQAAAATALLRMAYCDIYCNAFVKEAHYIIRNTLTGKVLTQAEAGLITSENQGLDKQIWTLNRQADGTYRFKTKGRAQFVSSSDAVVKDGSLVQTNASLDRSLNFSLVDAGNSIFRIVSKTHKKSLDGGPEAASDKAVYLWAVSDVPNQYWTIELWSQLANDKI